MGQSINAVIREHGKQGERHGTCLHNNLGDTTDTYCTGNKGALLLSYSCGVCSRAELCSVSTKST